MGDNEEMWLGLGFPFYDWDNCLEHNATSNLCIRYGKKYRWADGTEYQPLAANNFDTNGLLYPDFVFSVGSSGETQIKGVGWNYRQKYACITKCEGKYREDYNTILI